MKIISLIANNYMRLEAVEITPDGNAVIITGKNGSGKSDVLSSIVAALGGKKHHPQKPIREGCDSAEIKIITENWIIKRTFTAAGGGAVKITNADGMVAQSPQALLKKIVGEISFDPTVFANLGKTEAGKKQQRDLLMNLVGLDFSDIDGEIAVVKVDRSDVRKEKERYEHEANAITVADNLPEKKIEIADLTVKLQDAINHNAKQDTILEDGKTVEGEFQFHDAIVSQQAARISELESLIAAATIKRDEAGRACDNCTAKGKKILASAQERIDTEPITQAMGEVEATNTFIRQRDEKEELLAAAKEKTQTYAKLGKKMKELEQQKATRLAEAKMPVEGLSVSEDCVLYNGIPLSQEGGAKKLEISMAIAMEKNPELRVILMNGNELDDDSLQTVCDLAKKKDYQVWIERWAGGEGGIIIEDGSVKK